MKVPTHHQTLVDGFHKVADKNALGWAALDGKSETIVLSAIAASINRAAGQRTAHVEFPPRADLVLLGARLASRPRRHLDSTAGRIKMRYEAKAGHCFDFTPARALRGNKYLGKHLNEDMATLKGHVGAGLFFMHEAADPTRHLKYFGGPTVKVDDAVAVLCRFVSRGRLVAQEVMDCGLVDGTNVKIHMCIFDPIPGGAP